MKITKLVHACLLVEMPAPVSRTALFDPGSMSEAAIDIARLEYLDDIIITHSHGDHISVPLLQKLRTKFPQVRITTTPEVVRQLAVEGIEATSEASPGIVFFNSPHEDVKPMFPTPEEIGVHYLNLLTHPGDSHSFKETMPILALPVTAPWGSTVKATQLALELKPTYIIPIHDWHWSDEARHATYQTLEKLFKEHDIVFLKPETGVSVVINVEPET
jgi:L-ascorbate metabolism protein UlaG (beta-lactamase superfamily)